MKKWEVNLYTIQDDHIYSIPKYDGRTYYLETDDYQAIVDYIQLHYRDRHGHEYRAKYDHEYGADSTMFMGFALISRAGGVRIKEYIPVKSPNFIKI